MTARQPPAGWIATMAMETFVVIAASYDTLGAAEADYQSPGC